MSEIQSTDDSGTRILNRPKRRPVILFVMPLILSVTTFLPACSDTSSTTDSATPASETPDTTVQPVGEQSTLPPQEITSNDIPEADQVTEDIHTDPERAIRFTDSNADIWPPQPEGITEVASIPSGQLKISRTIKNTASIANSIGERHEILTPRVVQNKQGKFLSSDTEIYNYESNQVITVSFDASGKETLRSISNAEQYQPPETQAEVLRAIKLASIDLSKQGFTEHLLLNGTGLLAYPNTAESAATGASFFGQRKIYVTFGSGNGELPQYRALVNLSTNTVESSGSIQ